MTQGTYRPDDDEYTLTFVRASGPGGQNVNKVSTAVELRFHLEASALPDGVKARLTRLAGSRMTDGGDLLIFAQRFRSQERNREDAFERLAALVEKARTPPKPRKATRPSLASKARRLDSKGKRSETKRRRTRPDME